MGNSGLHNTLEPAVYGIPIIIGKNYKQFQEVVDLIKNKGVVSVEKKSDFNIISNDFINNKELKNKLEYQTQTTLFQTKELHQKSLNL